ncbi:MAG: hypothetical protein KJZ65_13835 [Phycisphaerales bacterium]|nr:hypothetical protein [Phycisphaerales bacterium]
MPPPVKYTKAVKLNRKELALVIEAFVKDGMSPGLAAWRKVCVKGIRNGKLDESSVDDCIAHVCQEVRKQVEGSDRPENEGNSGSQMSNSELRRMQPQMKKEAEKFI